MSDKTPPSEGAARRGFLTALGAMIIGTIAAAVPVATGAVALLDPLRRKRRDPDMVLVARLSQIPEDGTPRRFRVEADRVDGWSTEANAPIGAVYLRTTEDGVAALNVVCPHAGCYVGLAPDKASFGCPCHRSSFDLTGASDNPDNPSPRDMDALEVELRNEDEVWVRFLNFLPGREEQTPL